MSGELPYTEMEESVREWIVGRLDEVKMIFLQTPGVKNKVRIMFCDEYKQCKKAETIMEEEVKVWDIKPKPYFYEYR
jgi:hypothetical protein